MEENASPSLVQITERKEYDDEKTSDLECVVYSVKRTIRRLPITFRICGRVCLSRPGFTWSDVRYPIGRFPTPGRAEWRA